MVNINDTMIATELAEMGNGPGKGYVELRSEGSESTAPTSFGMQAAEGKGLVVVTTSDLARTPLPLEIQTSEVRLESVSTLASVPSGTPTALKLRVNGVLGVVPFYPLPE